MTDEIPPFAIDIPQADLDDLRDRLARTRWPDELPGAAATTGSRSATSGSSPTAGRAYDWRAWEARLNRLPAVHDRRSTARTSTSCTSARPSPTRSR